MTSYKTLKEKAVEWNVSLRHLQYLCKQERIEGAVKKAGAWFIPDNVPMPAQYTKIRNGNFNFIGTKKKIFHCALELFRQRGFEAVSMKDIADAVGITQSSVYNHFASKQKILDTGYDFYRYYFLKDRPDIESIDPVLRDGSLTDIVQSVHFLFGDDHFKQMADLTTIIFHRFTFDEQAKELIRSLVLDEGIRFVQSVFDRGVEIGRLAPLDTRTMSMLVNSIRMFTLHCWLADAYGSGRCLEDTDERNLYRMISETLTDLKPPTPKQQK